MRQIDDLQRDVRTIAMPHDVLWHAMPHSVGSNFTANHLSVPTWLRMCATAPWSIRPVLDSTGGTRTEVLVLC
jgi:hypothetical protein